MIAVRQLIWGRFVVCGSIIVVISIGGISSIIVRNNFDITIGGIIDVFMSFFGVVGVFEMFIVLYQQILDFFLSFKPALFSVALGNRQHTRQQHQGHQCWGHLSKIFLFFLVSGAI